MGHSTEEGLMDEQMRLECLRMAIEVEGARAGQERILRTAEALRTFVCRDSLDWFEGEGKPAEQPKEG